MGENSQGGALEDLEGRWKGEKSPQLTLQLAEEYRRRNDLGRAIEVLREGLEKHPSHVAAQVALGRFLLEANEPQEAASTLQQVVESDPTHLVANKLLVRAALAVGEPQRARDRLDLYATLSSGDADLEELESLVAAAMGEEGGSAGAALPPAPVGAEELPEGEPEAPGEAPEVQPEEVPAASEQPFGARLTLPDAVAYRHALEAEGLFSLAVRTVPKEVVATTGGAESTVTLGRLYLDQGHRREAADAFRAVLARDADNPHARSGLRDAESPGGVTARDLVDGDVLDSAESAGERKRLVLQGYLERLKTGAVRS